MLILETIRHLKEILSPTPVDNYNPNATCDGGKKIANPQAENRVGANLKTYLRVRRLAVKDAMWYLCGVFHILIGSRISDILPSAANSDNRLIEDLDQRQQAAPEILEKIISQELFELLIDTRLHFREKSRLPFDASQTPVGSLAGADITRTAVKTAQEPLVTLEEARSHRKAVQREKPMQHILDSDKQANRFESNCEIDPKTFDRKEYHDSKKFSNLKTVDGTVTEGTHMHHVLDDTEHGMLLCVVERYVNER
jgi:hypothetical protein